MTLTILGITIQIECDDPVILELLEEHYLECSRTAHGPVQSVLTIYATSNGYTVEIEGRRAELSLVKHWPRVDDLVHLIVERSSGGFLFAHAACILRGGNAAVFIGPSGSGKTTLALALQHQGCTILAEDTVPLEVGTALAVPYRTKPGLRSNTKNLADFFGWRGHLASSVNTCLPHRAPIKWVFFIAPPEGGESKAISIEDNLVEWTRMRDLCYGHPTRKHLTRTRHITRRSGNDFDRQPSIEVCGLPYALQQLARHMHYSPATLGQRLVTMSKLFENADVSLLRNGRIDETVALVLQRIS